MAETNPFIEAVKRTFRSRALRTVLIIDDQFPTYADAISDPEYLKKYKESDRAVSLYRMFRELDMPCDIENNLQVLTGDGIEHVHIEHMRKSDLIILDWQLTPGSTDSSKAIQIMRLLAETKHFNTIVLYTRERDIERVWLDIAASLRRGWADAEELLRDDQAAAEIWERLGDQEDAPRPTDDVIAAYILKGIRGIPAEQRKALALELQSQVPREKCTAIIEVLIHREVRRRLADDSAARKGPSRLISGSCELGRPLWLQCENCFVTVIHKSEGNTAAGTDPDKIMDSLDNALVAWRPSLLQVIISEIQNLLELEALATEQAHLREPEMQTGLSYYLLSLLGDDTSPDDVEQLLAPVEMIIDKLVENLRRRISGDQDLTELGVQLLSQELKELGWSPAKTASEVYSIAGKMARLAKPPEKEKTIFRLNSFLSTETFRRAHLTTGTVIRQGGSEDYWICVSPACDMTPREPVAYQIWAKDLHPLRAIVAVRLQLEQGHGSALSEAEHGRHIFLNTPDGPLCFRLLDKNSHQPGYEFLFVSEAGRVDRSRREMLPRFDGLRVLPGKDSASTERLLATQEFVVVGQMRPSYGNRVLQLIGQHLARIGLDFVDLPN